MKTIPETNRENEETDTHRDVLPSGTSGKKHARFEDDLEDEEEEEQDGIDGPRAEDETTTGRGITLKTTGTGRGIQLFCPKKITPTLSMR